MSDRIKLAESRGWTHIHMKWVEMDGKSYPFGCPPADQYSDGVVDKRFKEQIPDPFTDANDDYAVLEWMRVLADTGMRDDLEAWEKYAMALCVVDDGHDLSLIFNYQIGDYARAALKVIATEQEGET